MGVGARKAHAGWCVERAGLGGLYKFCMVWAVPESPIGAAAGSCLPRVAHWGMLLLSVQCHVDTLRLQRDRHGQQGYMFLAGSRFAGVVAASHSAGVHVTGQRCSHACACYHNADPAGPLREPVL
jgi:hypothetical protein